MFNYQQAFSRNIGWVTEKEQEELKNKRIAIAGVGGVGSIYLLMLSRLGISKFHISDFDHFEIHNFNRQSGALLSTLDQKKVSVMEKMAKDINPESDIKVFPDGVFEHNVDEFLDGVDLYIDGLDFFALEARKCVFQKCYEKNIPVITAAPLGMGCALLCFMPNKMSYEQYFCFNKKDNEEDQLIQFLIGLSPAMLQKTYLVETRYVNFKERRGPSTVMSVDICAGIVGTNALKILLKRGNVISAPYGLHFDAYRNKLVKTWLPFGNRGLFQRIMFRIVKNIVCK